MKKGGAGLIVVVGLLVVIGLVLARVMQAHRLATDPDYHAYVTASQRLALSREQAFTDQYGRVATAAATTATVCMVGGAAAFLIAALGGAVAFSRRSLGVWAHTLPLQGGVPPVLWYGGEIIDAAPAARNLAAVAAQGRLTAPTARHLAQYSGAWPPAPAPAALPSPAEPEALALPMKVNVEDVQLRRERLALPIGVDEARALVWQDLAAPWLLIAGTTGSGKSNLLALLVQAMLEFDPTGRRVQLCLFDLKRVTLTKVPANFACLTQPVAFDLASARQGFSQLRAEVDRRYAAFQKAGVVSIEQWNAGGRQAMPMLMMLVDEIANLYPTAHHTPADRQLLHDVQAQMWAIITQGRAAGVFGAVGTQYPSRAVVSEQLKANMPRRLAFHLPTDGNYELVLDARNVQVEDIPGRAMYLGRRLTPVQVPDVGLDDGRFDRMLRRIATLPGALRSEPVEWAVPVPVPGGNGAGAGGFSPSATEERERERRARKWDEFVRTWVRQNGARAGVSNLARAMAAADNRPDEYESFKSMAFRYLQVVQAEGLQTTFDTVFQEE